MIDLNDVDGPLQDIKYMAEIAAELIVNLDGINAPPRPILNFDFGRQPPCFCLQRFVAAG